MGDPSIDSQHKRLLEMTTSLHTAMAAGRGKDVLVPILQSLLDYTEQHFRYEETVLERNGYSDLENHKLIHRKLASEVRNLSSRARDGKLSATLDTMSLLRRWLIQHIEGDDRAYAKALKLRSV